MFTTTRTWKSFDEEMPAVGIPLLIAELGTTYEDSKCCVNIHRTLYYMDKDNVIVDQFGHSPSPSANMPHSRKRMYWSYLPHVDDIIDPRSTIKGSIGEALASNNKPTEQAAIKIGPLLNNG